MRVLLVKLTSIGDLIHTLPAISDATAAIPGISFDWVINKNFSEVALWHPAVKNIIPTSHRKWKKNIWQSIKSGEIADFVKNLRKEKYDLIIDAQSLIKSAIITRLARGQRSGMDKNSCREWLATYAYQKRYSVSRQLHAIQRLRSLFAQALNYPCPESQPNFGIDYSFPSLKFDLPKPYIVLVHNASWSSKLWPENHCREFIKLVGQEGMNVVLPWGDELEKQRAQRIAAALPNAQVLAFCTLSEHVQILTGAKGAVCTDTGLGHLASALNVPAVTVYGATSEKLVGATGLNQQHLVSSFPCTKCYLRQCHYDKQSHDEPLCLAAITPEMVWENLKKIILSDDSNSPGH